MRFRRRHAWGAALIALFALPVLKPDGISFIETPVADVVLWPARTGLNPERWKGGDDGDPDSARARKLERELYQVWELHWDTLTKVKDLQRLRAALRSAKLDRLPKMLGTRVLMASDPVPTRRSITIDRGADDGIEVGQPVVMGPVYLGRIRVLRSRSAIVQLVSDPRTRLEVFVRTDKNVLLRGYARRAGRREGRDEMQIEFVRTKDRVGRVLPGAPVFTANFDARVPAKLLVGTVSSVSDPDLDRMPILRMRPAFDLDRSTDAVVLLTSDTVQSPRGKSAATPSR